MRQGGASRYRQLALRRRTGRPQGFAGPSPLNTVKANCVMSFVALVAETEALKNAGPVRKKLKKSVKEPLTPEWPKMAPGGAISTAGGIARNNVHHHGVGGYRQAGEHERCCKQRTERTELHSYLHFEFSSTPPASMRTLLFCPCGRYVYFLDGRNDHNPSTGDVVPGRAFPTAVRFK